MRTAISRIRRRRDARNAILSVFLLVPACAASEAQPLAPMSDSSESEPGDTGLEDSAGPDTSPADTTAVDASVVDTSVVDTNAMDTAVVDTSVADTSVVVDTGADSGFKSTDHVHIYITNTCKVSVSPTSFTVPAGETLKLSYHNHSVDYRADVWMMYGGGYLGLDRGATWNETYAHCFGPSPSVGYADINIEGGLVSGCPGVRLNITCK